MIKMEEHNEYLSDLMDMYGNHVITSKEYFKRALEHGVPYEVIDEYWYTGRWRTNKKLERLRNDAFR